MTTRSRSPFFADRMLRRAAWYRATAGVAALATLFAPVVPALAAGSAPTKEKPARSEPPASSDVSTMVQTRMLPVAATSSSSGDPWRLFDNEPRSIQTIAPSAVQVSLSERRPLAGLTVFGSGAGTLTVSVAKGGKAEPVAGLTSLSLGPVPGWHRFLADQPVAADRLVLDWAGENQVGEVEIWGLAPRLAAETDVDVIGQLHVGLPRGGVEAPAEEGEIAVGTDVAAGGQSFHVSLQAEPRAFARAFLVYELSGLPHWTAAARRINEWPLAGGHEPRAGQGGLQVEEISPAWLNAGQNSIRFEAVGGANRDIVPYTVKHLRVVGLGPTGAPLRDQGVHKPELRALSDADPSTGVKANDKLEQTIEVAFSGPAQALDVSFHVADALGGKLVVESVGVQDSVPVPTALMQPGWHTLRLDGQLSVGEGVRLRWQRTGSSESRGTISEVDVTASPVGRQGRGLVVTYPRAGECAGASPAVRGFVEPMPLEPARTWVTGPGLKTKWSLSRDGAFSAKVPAAATGAWGQKIEATGPEIGTLTTLTRFDTACDGRPQVAGDGTREDVGAPFAQVVRPDKAATLRHAGMTLEIPEGAVKKATRVTIRPLGAMQVAQLNPGMTNVTPGGGAFRLGPHGTRFERSVKLTIPVDKKLLPPGTNEKEVNTFYFDEIQGRWLPISRIGGEDGVDVQSVSDHFTDFMNATLPIPDHPGADGFTPTSIADMKAADPAAGMTLIQPPSASQDGAAHISYPITLPPGRRGLAPTLALSYSSEAKNSWVGWGWDLHISSIEVDTRFGAPRYSDSQETETYLLDGAQLAPTANRPTFDSRNSSGDKQFYRRVEGAFSKIIRHGNAPSTYTWEVTDKQGTRYFYGENLGADIPTRLSESATGTPIFRWYLSHVEDTFGNRIDYTYSRPTGRYLGSADYPITSSRPLAPNQNWVNIYPASINYTGNGGRLTGKFTVQFVLQDLPRDDAFSSARSGFLVKTDRLLQQINVKDDTGAMIWQYALKYNDTPTSDRAPALGKSRLETLQVYGGLHHFYDHTFEYYDFPTKTSTVGAASVTCIDGYADPVAVSAGSITSAPFSFSAGLGLNEDLSASAHAWLGAGVVSCQLGHVGGGGGVGVSGGGTSVTFGDLNGDGLPDLLHPGSAFVTSRDPVTGAMSLGSQNYTGSNTLFLSNQTSLSADLQVGAHAGFDVFKLTRDYTWNWNNQFRVMSDFNGDGFPDLVTYVPLVGTFVRSGAAAHGGLGFDEEAATCGLPLTVPHDSSVDDLKNQLHPANPLVGWTAPFSGSVSIANSMTQLHTDGPAVLTSIFRGADPSGTAITDGICCSRLSSGATSACPSSSLPSCGMVSGVSVTQGQRLYFFTRTETSTVEGLPKADVDWRPVITYDSVAGIGALSSDVTHFDYKDPNAGPMYQYALSSGSGLNDFRLAGRVSQVWSAPANGTVHIGGTLLKKSTSDDVSFRVRRLRPNVPAVPSWPLPDPFIDGPPPSPVGPEDPLCVHPSVLYANDGGETGAGYSFLFTAGLTAGTNCSDFDVNVGDILEFTAVSDTPIDPDRVQWFPSVQYTQYRRKPATLCTTDSDCGGRSCVNNVCDADDVSCPVTLDASGAPTLPMTVDETNTPVINTGSGGCPGFPFPNAVPDKSQLLAFPTPHFPTRGMANPNWESDGSVDGGLLVETTSAPPAGGTTATPPGTVVPLQAIPSIRFSAAGSVSYSIGVTSDSTTHNATLIVHGVNKQFSKTAMPPSYSGTVTGTIPGGVAAGDQVFVSLFTQDPGDKAFKFGTTPVFIFTPSGGGAATTYLVGGTVYRPDTTRYAMSGGYRGWAYGAFTSGIFVENDIAPPVPMGSPAAPSLDNLIPRRSTTGIPAGALPLQPVPTSHFAHPGDAFSISSSTLVPSVSFTGTKTSDGQSGFERISSFASAPALRKGRGDGQSSSLGAVVTYDHMTGTNSSQVDFLDVNGDSFPDSVTPTALTLQDGFGCYAARTTCDWTAANQCLWSDESLSNVQTDHKTWGLSIGGAGSTAAKLLEHDTVAAVLGYLPSVQRTYGSTSTSTELLDVNGDGLVDQVSWAVAPPLDPDQVGQVPSGPALLVRFNLGGKFGPPVWMASLVTWAGGSDISQSPSVLSVNPNRIRVEDSFTANLGFSINHTGVGPSYGVARTMVDMIDVNGDGLPDYVKREPGSDSASMKVRLNLGDHFDDERPWCMPAWPDGAADSILFGNNDALTLSGHLGFSGSFGLDFSFPLFIFCLQIEAALAATASDSVGDMNFQDFDGDGVADHVLKKALTSNVYAKLSKQGTTNFLKAVHNPLGGSFTLQYARVGNEVHYSGVVDYEGSPLRVDMPHNQWALSQVSVVSEVNNGGPQNWGPFATNFSYESGFYDRAERENYGYYRVTTTRPDGSLVDQYFHNQDFYKRGLLRKSIETDFAGNLYDVSLHTYSTLPVVVDQSCSGLVDLSGAFDPSGPPDSSFPTQVTKAAFAAETSRVIRHYEGLTASEAGTHLETSESRTYNSEADVRSFTDFGSPGAGDDARFEVTYKCSDSPYFRKPETVLVKDSSSTVLRSRTAGYEPATGFLNSMSLIVKYGNQPGPAIPGTTYDGSQSQAWGFGHDSYGNLSAVDAPTGMHLDYTYDTATNAYRHTATDSFGLTETFDYDVAHGAPTQITDTNGAIDQYLYDSFGRLKEFRGPAQSGVSGSSPTITVEYQHPLGGYFPGTTSSPLGPRWARTGHLDESFGDADPINTATFIDGLGRVVETKKDLVKDLDSSPTEGMAVSGLVIFDSRGRVAQQHQPEFEDRTDQPTTYRAQHFLNPTFFSYDIQGRAVLVTHPDGTNTATNYAIQPATTSGTLCEQATVRDVYERQRVTYRTVRREIAEVDEENAQSDSPTFRKTGYAYDPLSQLLQVTDANGNITTASYNSLGEMVNLASPDSGTVDYRFDLAGQLTTKITAAGTAIGYTYDHGRLTNVAHSGMPSVTYTYGTSTDSDHRGRGRIVKIKDESGYEERFYGDLGDIVRVEKTPTKPGAISPDDTTGFLTPINMSLPICAFGMAPSSSCRTTYVSQYSRDSFNRLLTTTQPDGEFISYVYDRGGNLDAITQLFDGTSSTPTLYVYLQHIGYDEFDSRRVVKFGNGAKSKYDYDLRMRRLTDVTTTSGSSTPQALHYDYDLVGNVTDFFNNAAAPGGDGGKALHAHYAYDRLYQLSTANGTWAPFSPVTTGDPSSPTTYSLSMTYDAIGNIATKTQNAGAGLPTTYTNSYTYGTRPHAPTALTTAGSGNLTTFSYDPSGNQTLATSFVRETGIKIRRELLWDEENRLKRELERPWQNVCSGDTTHTCSADSDCSIPCTSPAAGGYAESNDWSYTTATTPQTKVSKSFSVPADGKYLILSTADIGSYNTNPNTNVWCVAQTVVDGTIYSQSQQFQPSPASLWDFVGYGAHQLLTLTAGTHTASIQFNSNYSGTRATIQNARVIAIPISSASDNAQTPETVATTTNPSSFDDELSLAVTPTVSETYLVIASAQITDQSGTVTARLTKGSPDTDQGTMIYTPPWVNYPGSMYRSFFVMREFALTAAQTKTFKIQMHTGSQRGGIQAKAHIKDARITAIPLSALPVGAVGYGESEDQATTTNPTLFGSWIASVTATPAAYLAVGTAFIGNQSTSGEGVAGLFTDMYTDFGEQWEAPAISSADMASFENMSRVDWEDGAQHKAWVKYAAQNGGTAVIGNARALLMPLPGCGGRPDGKTCAMSPGCSGGGTCTGGVCSPGATSLGTCGLAPPSNQTTFLYNHEGQRTHKRNAGNETVYVSPTFSIRNTDAAQVTRHVFAGETRLASAVGAAGSATKYFYHPDHLQSTQYMTDSTGAIAEHTEFLPSGETWIQGAGWSGGTPKTPWLFTSKEFDGETGLQYFGARYYDPRATTWVSADPILSEYVSGRRAVAPPDLNVFGYARNNPVCLRDVDGRQTPPREPPLEEEFEVYEEEFRRAEQEGMEPRIRLTREDFESLRAIRTGERTIDSETFLSAEPGFEPLPSAARPTPPRPPTAAEEDARMSLPEPAPVPELEPSAPPQRFEGPWTPADLKRAEGGKPPLDMLPRNAKGARVPPALHHGGQMPGSGVHEVDPERHNAPGTHANKFNQGVSPERREADRHIHWQTRGQEHGNPPPPRAKR